MPSGVLPVARPSTQRPLAAVSRVMTSTIRSARQREIIVIRHDDGADVLAIAPALDGAPRGAPDAGSGGGFRGRHVAFLSSGINVHSRNNKPGRRAGQNRALPQLDGLCGLSHM